MSPLVVITGAAGGIGRATVEVFASEGWEVIGLDRKLAADPIPRARFERVDVSEPEAVRSFFADLAGTAERLDALVNNAAIQLNKPLVDTTVEEWDAVQASNLRSVYLTARHAHALLEPSAGSIVNVSSVHAVASSVDVTAYAASKGGILALTRAMAVEFGSSGIRVNAVLPGAVDTPMLRDGLSRGHLAAQTVEEQLEEIARKTVLARVGRVEEIARAILFLADSRQSSFVTGQALVVDGGATARLSTE